MKLRVILVSVLINICAIKYLRNIYLVTNNIVFRQITDSRMHEYARFTLSMEVIERLEQQFASEKSIEVTAERLIEVHYSIYFTGATVARCSEFLRVDRSYSRA